MILFATGILRSTFKLECTRLFISKTLMSDSSLKFSKQHPKRKERKIILRTSSFTHTYTYV